MTKVGVASLLVAGGFFCAANLHAARNPEKSTAGDYACSFSALSSYQAPNTSTAVNVGGIFTVAIDKQGTITPGTEVISVDDGGNGSAVCRYDGGSGDVATPPSNGGQGTATFNFTPANGNSNLCPSGSATLKFVPVEDGLQFLYTNSSGFTGNGGCGLAGAPNAGDGDGFKCTYDARSGGKQGSGLSAITFVPSLTKNENPRLASAGGVESYSGMLCPVVGLVGVGLYFHQTLKGNWAVIIPNPPSCPESPFEQVDFVTTKTEILITAPGISNAKCSP
jgi:hypothetical protein